MSTATLFFFNDTATTEIYTLSLHDALPILGQVSAPGPDGARVEPLEPCHRAEQRRLAGPARPEDAEELAGDRKSTRLNSSHSQISYAVFCLKKKNPATIMWVRAASRCLIQL